MAQGLQSGGSSGRSLGVKLLIVGALVVLLGVPLGFVNILAWERANRAAEVATEVGSAHGGTQTIRGPFLILPVTVSTPVETVTETGTLRQIITTQETIIVSPDTLEIQTRLATRILRRAIYEVPVYQADLRLTGSFRPGAALALLPEHGAIDWDGARLFYAVSDLRGIDADFDFAIAGRESQPSFEPWGRFNRESMDYANVSDAWRGISAPLNRISPDTRIDFDGSLVLSGASRFSVIASGRETRVAISGDWASPGFAGAYLPDRREISQDGFAATWSVPYLARGVPAQWVEGRGYSLFQADEAKFEVNLISPTDGYVRVSRSLKYAFFFVGFTLLMMFLIEASGESRIHAAQYILIGLAQVIFYLLLLALSEHVLLGLAFFAAAAATIALTALYAWSAFKAAPKAAITFAALTLSYILQFVLVLVEDYALLIGATLAFLAIAVTMYVTRGVDWYGLSARAGTPEVPR